MAWQPEKDQRFLRLSDSEKKEVKYHNERRDPKRDDDCEWCHGKRFYFITPSMVCDCVCKKKHDNMLVFKQSGLGTALQEMQFEDFVAKEGWQIELKQKAEKFAENPEGNWFFIGGQPGCGKTHLCSAILYRLVHAGRMAKYMVWSDHADSIKGNADGFVKRLEDWAKTDVLYIDDFLKVARDAYGAKNTYRTASGGDLAAAFKLLNRRYNQKDCVTIISSEFSIDEILNMDEALGSRIYQRSKEYQIYVAHDRYKNHRLLS